MDANNMRTPTQQQICIGTPSTIRTHSSVPAIDPTKPQTPRNGSTTTFYTPNTVQCKNGRFRLFNVVSTPPPIHKIINPFEAALSERLHLPLICSPSLFNRPSTPQMSSTQFEWTIDDVSSFNPANVEAHETQFMSVIDPDEEAKAQAAISLYFKDKLFVPSPIDCQLRNKKIILPSRSSSGSVKRPVRDAVCQTELTLPSNLPKEIEDLLRPYFSYTVDQQQSPYKLNCDTSTAIDHDARDASLRRKLFGNSLKSDESSGSGDYDLQCSLSALSPPPLSPKLGPESLHTRNFDSPKRLDHMANVSRSSVNDCASSFGSISPISKESTTTHSRVAVNNLSPIQNSSSYLSTSSIYRSTPDRSSMVYRTCSSSSIQHMSVDMSIVASGGGFLNRSNLAKHKSLSASMYCADNTDIHMMTSIGRSSTHTTSSTSEPNTSDSNESFEPDDAAMMSNSSQHPETPTRRRRFRVSRKNLSHSFSSSPACPTSTSDDAMSAVPTADNDDVLKCRSLGPSIQFPNCIENGQGSLQAIVPTLSKTDSGFTDMEE